MCVGKKFQNIEFKSFAWVNFQFHGLTRLAPLAASYTHTYTYIHLAVSLVYLVICMRCIVTYNFILQNFIAFFCLATVIWHCKGKIEIELQKQKVTKKSRHRHLLLPTQPTWLNACCKIFPNSYLWKQIGHTAGIQRCCTQLCHKLLFTQKFKLQRSC